MVNAPHQGRKVHCKQDVDKHAYAKEGMGEGKGHIYWCQLKEMYGLLS
jgi:hypothetical protein